MAASVVLSFDFELGWGAIENGLWERREALGVYDNLRNVLPVLLNDLKRLNIASTWATVGGMVDKSVLENLSYLPEQVSENLYKTIERSRSSSFYGEDLMALFEDEILCKLASHTYSHTRFSYPGFTEDMVKHEISLCNSIWHKLGKKVDTLVFPQNHEGFYKVLSDNGICKVRGAENSQKSSLPSRVLKNFFGTPPLSKGREAEGLKIETGSLLYKVAMNERYRLPLLEKQLKRGLKSCFKKQGVLHIYTHPFNLSESKELFTSFRSLLELIASERDGGQLLVSEF